MFKTYDLFDHRNINDLVPEIVYYYLFKGLSLTAIEVKLFKTEDYHGWLSKTFLNYYGIDTEKENNGLVSVVVEESELITALRITKEEERLSLQSDYQAVPVRDFFSEELP